MYRSAGVSAGAKEGQTGLFDYTLRIFRGRQGQIFPDNAGSGRWLLCLASAGRWFSAALDLVRLSQIRLGKTVQALSCGGIVR